MSVQALIAQVVPLVVQPVQDSNQDGWWKWVALSFIGLLVVSVGAFAVLIARNFVLDQD